MGTKEARIKAFKDLHDKAAKAKGVVARSSAEFQRRVKKHLEAGGVVLKEGHVDVDAPDKDGNVVTREGETISGVDLVLKATGFTFAGEKLADASLKNESANAANSTVVRLCNCSLATLCLPLVTSWSSPRA